MKNTILHIFIGILLLTFPGSLCAEKGGIYATSSQDLQAMHEEAENYLDEASDGRQDMLADAIRHAMRGMTSELNEFRKLQDSPSNQAAEEVVKKDFYGEGSSRALKMRLYSPRNAASSEMPLLVYLHGGGWAYGGLNSGSVLCAGIAASGKAAVLAVEYSLSPEKQYPTALYECVAAMEYAFANVSKWGCSPSRISIAGDEAGGNLALATALYLQTDNSVAGSIHSIILFDPILKCFRDNTSPSWKKYSRGYGLDARALEACIESYQGTTADSTDPLMSPASASPDALKLLPPILLINASRSILASQIDEFVKTGGDDGCKITHISFPETLPGYISGRLQPTALKKAVEMTTAFLLND